MAIIDLTSNIGGRGPFPPKPPTGGPQIQTERFSVLHRPLVAIETTHPEPYTRKVTHNPLVNRCVEL